MCDEVDGYNGPRFFRKRRSLEPGNEGKQFVEYLERESSRAMVVRELRYARELLFPEAASNDGADGCSS